MSAKLWWFLVAALGHAALYAATNKEITLPGLPLQLDWVDSNQDGKLDLQALMLLSQTTGDIDTFFEDGSLKGLYEDVTQKEKYFVTYLQTETGWQETEKIALGEANILGFVMENSAPFHLNIWTQERLTRYRWEDTAWKPFSTGKTPGLLAHAPTTLSNFSFLHKTQKGTFWTVPDLAGIHVIQPDNDYATTFLEYPKHSLDSNYASSEYHRQSFQLPEVLNIDGKEDSELAFIGNKKVTVYEIGANRPSHAGLVEGKLIDLDGDGLADRMQIEENHDIDRLKDLPKVKSKVTVYRATAPLTFEKEPITEQDLAGFLIDQNESDIQLAPPFSDINQDGRIDLAGIAMKMSMWQIAKLVSIGRLKLKFLLHLHVQNPDGSFKTLANGPYQMTWKINIRKLKLPEFAQIAADYNGDGWWDILQVGDSKLSITPVTEAGFQKEQVISVKIPRKFRKPDQAYGRDIDSNGRSEIILIKLDNQQTRLSVVEVNP